MLGIFCAIFLGILVIWGLYAIIVLIKQSNSHGSKTVAFIACILLLVISAFLFYYFGTKANKDTEISNVTISEVYKEKKANTFLVITDGGETYSITAENVYKGDSNYVIKKHRVNTTPKLHFWTWNSEYVYELVVTDTNFKDIPKLTD